MDKKKALADMLNMTVEKLGQVKFLEKPLKCKEVPCQYPELGNCFECTSHSVNSGGYPSIRDAERKHLSLHRYTFERCYGEIPEGMVIRHLCDNPNCINPHHLKLGTHEDNVRDRQERGRQAKGERNGRAKLTAEQVLEIRKDTRPDKEIAAEYGVNKRSIDKIKKYEIWKHL